MTVIAYRYRAYPNAGQRELFARHFGCKRKVFNLYLEEAHRLFQKTGSILSAYAFIKKLPAMKRTPELKYLAEVNSQSLQSAVLNAAESFERFAYDQKLFAEGSGNARNRRRTSRTTRAGETAGSLSSARRT